MSFSLHTGSLPLLISMPHIGTEIPADLKAHLVPRALASEDTDWHLAQLYDFAAALGASVLQPQFSRYAIDLNRPPDDAPMYPGASNTELCPTRFFTGEPLYRAGCAPDAHEIARRRNTYWAPYHHALQAELQRLHRTHGYALVWGDRHRTRTLDECGERCLNWKPQKPSLFACNVFVFCPLPKCYAPAALPPGSMTGQVRPL